MRFCGVIHDSQRITPYALGGSLTFPVLPPGERYLWLTVTTIASLATFNFKVSCRMRFSQWKCSRIHKAHEHNTWMTPRWSILMSFAIPWLPLPAPAGSHIWFTVKCLNNSWMDYPGVQYRHSWSTKDEVLLTLIYCSFLLHHHLNGEHGEHYTNLISVCHWHWGHAAMQLTAINSNHNCASKQPHRPTIMAVDPSECNPPHIAFQHTKKVAGPAHSRLHFSVLHWIVCCCFLLYTLWTFPRERCIVLQGLKFTEDYICSSTAEQCRGVWGPSVTAQ